MARVLTAMSGGVDSTVAAKLLIDEGHETAGATMKLFSNPDIGLADRACCSLDAVEDARAAADLLGIRHYVFNLSDRFRKKVMMRFAAAYLEGLTPNPCIDCNRFIKYEDFLDRAYLLGYDHIATGHYAGVEYDKLSGRWLLKRAPDRKKDQAYVLYSMTQFQLSRTLFPVGSYSKEQIRKVAESVGFRNAKKPESQDICFVQEKGYAAFIEDFTGQRMCGGNFISKDGEVLGKHGGVGRYTIGQRKGLHLSFERPMYVTVKDACTNTVVLGEEADLYAKRLAAGEINWIAVDSPKESLKVTVQTRYHQKEAPATVIPLSENEAVVEFENPHKAPAPGQAVVFYDGDVVVGGGVIQNAVLKN